MDTYFELLPEEIRNKKFEKSEFPFSEFLFWDSGIGSIDLAVHKNYIIERVLSRGLLKDFYFLLKIYSKQEIINCVKKSRNLDKKTANFCSHYFNIPLTQINASSYYS